MIKEACHGVCKTDKRIRRNVATFRKTNKEEAANDQELNRKIEEILFLIKDMAGKSNLSRPEPRYEEVLSFMDEIAEKAMEQKRKKDSEVVQEKVSCAGESSKKGEEDHGKMEQLVSTSQSGKRVGDTGKRRL